MRRYVRESDASPEKTVALEHHALESGALRPAAPTASARGLQEPEA